MTFEELSAVGKSTMCRLFIFGPLHEARAAKFAAGLDELIAAGWVWRIPPWSFLSPPGVVVAGSAKVTDKQWLSKQMGA
ncbi:MAG TPA: hypothetical protein DEQ40_00420 [Oxalobacteraceae bacterium]|jgi:hypothetical protein|nr:hypothetical protein [Oxalobacteraceae bacterium]